MQSAWSSCLSSSTDVKELIPEFFMGSHGGDFLLNRLGLPLGLRQNGRCVGGGGRRGGGGGGGVRGSEGWVGGGRGHRG